MSRSYLWFAGLALPVAALLISGCNQGGSTEPTNQANSQPAAKPVASATNHSQPTADAHEHKAGAHSGIIVEIGRDSYHAEAVFAKDGMLRLFTLGNDESKVQDVESQDLTAYVKPEGGADSATFTLAAQPKPGDATGKTSLFVGQLPKELVGQRLEVTIPSIRVGGDRYRIAFKSVAEAHHDEPMLAPSNIADDDERKLYLQPGGLYTIADIEANGKVTASEKFKGFVPKHDLKPKVGEKICPITLTKSNPECTWIVGGKKYDFCCPPCVEEFVKLAKENPSDVKDPDAYIKR